MSLEQRFAAVGRALDAGAAFVRAFAAESSVSLREGRSGGTLRNRLTRALFHASDASSRRGAPALAEGRKGLSPITAVVLMGGAAAITWLVMSPPTPAWDEPPHAAAVDARMAAAAPEAQPPRPMRAATAPGTALSGRR